MGGREGEREGERETHRQIERQTDKHIEIDIIQGYPPIIDHITLVHKLDTD